MLEAVCHDRHATSLIVCNASRPPDLVLTIADSPRRAQQLTPAQSDFFENKIRPILVNNCYKCHSQQAPKLKGGLSLDSRDGLLKGGDTGPAIVPGDPEKSLLIKAVRYTDPDLQMPPKDQKLPDAEIADLDDLGEDGRARSTACERHRHQA